MTYTVLITIGVILALLTSIGMTTAHLPSLGEITGSQDKTFEHTLCQNTCQNRCTLPMDCVKLCDHECEIYSSTTK